MVGVFRSEVRQAREGLGPQARPWERTGMIDVEQLVLWAYGPQAVDRFERVGLNAIEAAVSGFEPRGYSSDGVGQLMQIEHLGCRIDRCSVTVSDTCHPAAYAVAQELGQVECGGRVRFHALSGSRPREWMPPEQYARAAVWVKPWEKAQVEYQGPGRKGAYCQVIMLWDTAREEWGRQQYRTWWTALADLAWRLQARALGFTVTGPAAPAEPWLVGERAEPSSISLDDVAEGTPPGAGPPGAPATNGVRQRGPRGFSENG